jgi:hypothetical protein
MMHSVMSAILSGPPVLWAAHGDPNHVECHSVRLLDA